MSVAECSWDAPISDTSITEWCGLVWCDFCHILLFLAVTSITVSLLLVLILHFLVCVCSSGQLRVPNSVTSITAWCGLVWCDFCHIFLFLAVTSVTISILLVLTLQFSVQFPTSYCCHVRNRNSVTSMEVPETLSHPWRFDKSRMWHCILSLPWLSVTSLTASDGRLELLV